jgi:hypothetical protein
VFALSGRLVRVLGAVVQVSVLPMSDRRHDHSSRRCIASQLIRDHHARPPSTASQQLKEEAHRGVSITLGLDQDVDHGTVLVDSAPINNVAHR